MDPLSIFPKTSNEHHIISRFQTTFLPLLPLPLQQHFLTFRWRSLAFRPSSIYPSSHRLAKAIRVPVSAVKREGYIKPDSIEAVANVVVLQCIWGHRALEQPYYLEVQRYWGDVLKLLPTEPCEGLNELLRARPGRGREGEREEGRGWKGGWLIRECRLR